MRLREKRFRRYMKRFEAECCMTQTGQTLARDLFAALDWRALAAPLDRASDALARLDERLRLSPQGEGWRERLHYHDACAAIWEQGDLASLEDVVLREAGMDVRLASDPTNRALAVLRTRRRLSTLSAERVLSRQELERLCGGAPAVPLDGGDGRIWLSRDEDAETEGLPLDLFVDAMQAFSAVPAPLAAALCGEAWRRLDPAPRQPELAALVAAVLLKKSGRTKHHLAPIALGAKEARLRLPRGAPVQARIEAALAGMEAGAVAGRKELDRLAIAAERIAAKCANRRADSRLADLGALLIDLPLVSAPLAARRLKVTQQAVQKMMAELDGVAREVTGRGRYRAWAIL